jgi:hypothetical protein
METHGPLAASVAIWLTMFSPLIGMIIALLSAWLLADLPS